MIMLPNHIRHWRSQVTLLWWAQLISMAALEMSGPFWPLYLRDLGNFNTTELQSLSAVVYVSPLGMAMFFAPIWGRMGDRFGHKAMVLRALLALCVTQGIIFFAADIITVVICRLLQGALAGFIIAAQIYAIQIVPANKKGGVLGKLQSGTAGAMLIGPIVGGLVANSYGYRVIFIIAAMLCGVCAIALYFFLINDQSQITNTGLHQSVTPSSTSGNFSNSIVLLLLVIVCVQVAKMMPVSFFALFVEQRISGSPFMIGILYSSTGFTLMLSAPFWGRLSDSYSSASMYRVLCIVAAFSALTMLAHEFIDSFEALLILRLIWGLWLGAMLPVLFAVLSRLASCDRKGQIIGVGHSATKLGGLLGIITGAVAVNAIGVEHGFTVVGVVYCAVVAIFWFMYLGLR